MILLPGLSPYQALGDRRVRPSGRIGGQGGDHDDPDRLRDRRRPLRNPN